MGLFRRRERTESMDPQELLRRGHADMAVSSGHDDDDPPAANRSPIDFRMTVADVFSIRGRGTVVTGRIETGSVHTGQRIRLTRLDGSVHDVEVTAIEAFRKVLDEASAGDTVGILLLGIDRDAVAAGDTLTA
jgi:translation elongation factor EF-Tu-like GTPase